jgi:hypothetical protein
MVTKKCIMDMKSFMENMKGRQAIATSAGSAREWSEHSRASRGVDGFSVADLQGLARHGQALARLDPIAGDDASIAGTAAARAPGELRAAERLRMRLRSAKILSGANKFLCECQIRDRSPGGLRLVLLRDATLPATFCLYLDESGETLWTALAWRRGSALGVKVRAPISAPPFKPSDRFALRQRYYAVAN